MADEKKNDVKTETQGTGKEQPKETPKEPTIDELKAKVKDLEGQLGKAKDATSKASSDAASWKDKYRATLDDAKRKEEEQADSVKQMETELATLRAEKRVSEYTAKFLEAGADSEIAAKLAESLPSDVQDAFWENMTAFLTAQKQKVKTEALNGQPKLPSGMPPSNDGQTDPMRKWFGL